MRPSAPAPVALWLFFVPLRVSRVFVVCLFSLGPVSSRRSASVSRFGLQLLGLILEHRADAGQAAMLARTARRRAGGRHRAVPRACRRERAEASPRDALEDVDARAAGAASTARILGRPGHKIGSSSSDVPAALGCCRCAAVAGRPMAHAPPPMRPGRAIAHGWSGARLLST